MTKLFNRIPPREDDAALNDEGSTPIDGEADAKEENPRAKKKASAAAAWVQTNEEFKWNDLLPGDMLTEIYKRGKAEWDDRLGDVISQKNNWRNMAFGAMGVAGIAIAGCIYLGSLPKTEVVTLERDKNLDVVAVRSAGVRPYGDPAYIAADLKRWITNVRTVYTDANAIKKNINSAYTMISQGSPANKYLDEFYLRDDVFEKAKKLTVEVTPEYAIPNGDNVPDSEGRVTWRVEWQEQVSGRDGSIIRTEKWTATVTFILVDPDSAETVAANPTGIYITNISWSNKDIR